MRFMTRGDVALLLEISPDMVRRNEKRLGLDRCRVDVNAKVVRYWRGKARKALKAWLDEG